MRAVPIEFKDCNSYVEKYHRHHKPCARDKFRVACEEDGEIVGVIQVGRPLSRYLADGKTLEVLRCCTNGRPNVCSFLYSRAARIAKEMGYEKIITYILQSEIGTSLKASGWELEEPSCGGGYMGCSKPATAANSNHMVRRRTEISDRKETKMVQVFIGGIRCTQ